MQSPDWPLPDHGTGYICQPLLASSFLSIKWVDWELDGWILKTLEQCLTHSKSYIRISWLIPSDFFFFLHRGWKLRVGPTRHVSESMERERTKGLGGCKRPSTERAVSLIGSQLSWGCYFPTWKHCCLEYEIMSFSVLPCKIVMMIKMPSSIKRRDWTWEKSKGFHYEFQPYWFHSGKEMQRYMSDVCPWEGSVVVA